MFVNFKKTFKNNKKSISIPPILVNYLNSNLPTGYEYKSTTSGELVLTTKHKKFNISGFRFNLNESQKKILGDNVSLDNVLKYSYNSQEAISLKFEKEGYIKLDGKEIPVKYLHYNFDNPIKINEKSFKMFPYKFPEPFIVKFGNETYSKNVKIQRIPNKSINVHSFCSLDEESLIIKYEVDVVAHKLNLIFSFNLNNSKSIEDIITTLSLYNSFLDGNIMINGEKLTVNTVEKDKIKKVENYALEFWMKAKEIENVLDVKFDLNNFIINDEIYSNVNEIYMNLILKTPIKDKNSIDSINGEWSEEQIVDVKLSPGTPLFFEFEATKEYVLFNKKLLLHTLVNIFNSKIKEITTTKIVLENEDDNKKKFTSSMCFLTYEDMQKFKNKDPNERIKLFYNAKSI